MLEISTQLQSRRYQEEHLLEQLRSSRNLANPVGTEIAKSILGEFSAIATRELMGMPSIGRKVGRAYVGQQQRQNQLEAEKRIDGLHKQCVASITGFLATINKTAPKFTSSEVNRFVKMIFQAQSYVRLETRISKTITALESIESMHLLANQRRKGPTEKSPLVLAPKFPGLVSIRGMLPEVEPTLRQFIRSSMQRLF